ncbi:MAG: hypothetical protein HY961_13510 [Ignavibacteriae bacterium]|nr:hypothetical protein [Ignavibacteriota bacterium]
MKPALLDTDTVLGSSNGHTDTLIAGIALANNLVIVTNNTAHFTRIKNLEVENWMA